MRELTFRNDRSKANQVENERRQCCTAHDDHDVDLHPYGELSVNRFPI